MISLRRKKDLTCQELVELVTDYLDGALPPYAGLQRKFLDARNFDEAFELRSKKGLSSRPKARKSAGEGFELREFAWDLIKMGRDHQFPTHALSGNS